MWGLLGFARYPRGMPGGPAFRSPTITICSPTWLAQMSNARHPDVLGAQRRERARIRSERQRRWGQPATRAAWPQHLQTLMVTAL